MAHTRDVSSDDAKMRSSHRALVNQVLKSPIELSPPSSLPNWTNREFSARERFTLSVSDMQSLFNHLDVVQLALNHRYDAGYVYWGKPSRKMVRVLGDSAVSVRLMFADSAGNVMFDVHCFLVGSVQGIDVQASGKLDPKYLELRQQVLLEVPHQAARDAHFQNR